MSYQKRNNYKSNYNKEEWIKRKNRERDELYRKIDISAEKTLKDEKLFKQYLDIQSRFSSYSVGNALLISLQMPNTTIFKEKAAWNKKGINLKDDAKSFEILEPSSPYERPDGTKATYYNPKKMYDISQTDSKPSDKAKVYGTEELLRAFIHDCPTTIKCVDELKDNTLGAEYDKTEDILYICKGLDENVMFQAISSELAKISMSDSEENVLLDFESYCVSYMICKKYGIDVSNYNFDVLPPEVQEMNVTQFREELGVIRDAMLDVDLRINNNLEKNQKNKEHER